MTCARPSGRVNPEAGYLNVSRSTRQRGLLNDQPLFGLGRSGRGRGDGRTPRVRPWSRGGTQRTRRSDHAALRSRRERGSSSRSRPPPRGQACTGSGGRPPEDLLENADLTSCPVAGPVTVKRAASGAVSSACTFQSRLPDPYGGAAMAAAGAGLSVATSRSWRGRFTRWCARTVYPPVRTRGVRGAERSHIRQQPRVEPRHVRHVAARVREASSGKVSSQTVRTVRPTSVHSIGHSWRSRSWLR